MRTISEVILKSLGIALVSSLFVGLAQADNTQVRWERIEGINPTPAPAILGSGQVIGGFMPVGFPWSTTRGSAQLNTVTGRFQLSLEGLSLGANSPAPIGTTGVFTELKATIICDGGSVDSKAFALSKEGDAFFQGKLASLPYCQDDFSDMILLLRVVHPSPLLDGRWLAHGAARRIQ